VAAVAETALAVKGERHPADHPGPKVPSGRAEHHHHAAGHVLAAVVAHALHHRRGAAVADAETLAGEARGVHLGSGGAGEDGVPDDQVLLGREACARRRTDDDAAPGKTLAHVVVGIALELECHARSEERAEALTGRALEPDADAVVGETGRAPEAGDLSGE